MDGSEEYTTECLDFEQRLEDNESLGRRKFCDIKPANKKYEIQELSELSSKEEWDRCKKPQGHDGFLPWQKFLEDAKSYLCQDGINNDSITFDYIKTSGALVVRLVVSYVSGERPEELYPTLFKYRETNYNFTGSGIVIYTERSTERCRCCKCKDLPEKRESTWNVYISTATHVVFNHKEAAWTTAELFYDSETRTNIKRLFVQCVDQRSITGDSCVLKSVTCNEKLYHELTELLTKQKQLYDALPLCEIPTAVIISHPHGMHKHISWGHCQVVDTAQDQIFWMTSYKYKTTTCPGSSGAPVLILHKIFYKRHSNVKTCNYPVHAGANTENKQFCSEYQEPTLFLEIDPHKAEKEDFPSQHSPSLSKMIKIKYEPLPTRDTPSDNSCLSPLSSQTTPNKYSQPSENDLKAGRLLQVNFCQTNPGHINFYPLKEFTLDHLPRRYRDAEVLEFINILGALSCKLKINRVSKDRPQYVDGFIGGYPFFKDGGYRCIRFGTCSVVGVTVMRNAQCPCDLCLCSLERCDGWYAIYIKVATHVVFNNEEARRSKIILDYDDEALSTIVLQGVRVVYSDLKGDWSIFLCVSHDKNLKDKLQLLLEKLYILEQMICLKYFDETVTLTIVISHLHGKKCKRVSFGELTSRCVQNTTYDNITCKLTYTTPTCPGSSGAAVYVLGQKFPKIIRRFISLHVHSDNLEDGWNKSGYAIEDYAV